MLLLLVVLLLLLLLLVLYGLMLEPLRFLQHIGDMLLLLCLLLMPHLVLVHLMASRSASGSK